MVAKIDFRLNRSFGIVEQIIFSLVCSGFTKATEIADAMPIFTNNVIAKAIQLLVNRQIISVKPDTGELLLSDPLKAIIEVCLHKKLEINAPDSIKNLLYKDGLYISIFEQKDYSDKQLSKNLAKAILYELIPGINLDLYVCALDFILYVEQQG